MQLKPITAIAVLLLVVASLLVAGCTNAPTSSSPTPTPTPSTTLVPYVFVLPYENTAAGFKMEIPKGWENVSRTPTTDDPIAAIFYLPMNNKSEQVNVIVTPAGGADFDKVTMTNLDNAQTLVDNKKIDMISSSETTLAGQTAYMVVYNNNAAGLRSMQIWTVKNDKVYQITYNAPPQNYNDYIATVAKMIDSFQITS